jgi:flagellar basal-body rod protein FlgC
MTSNLLPAIQQTASALTAERTRLEVVAQNIANANTTRDVNGQTYRRKQVLFESMLMPKNGESMQHAQAQGVRVPRLIEDQRPFQQVYMPGHPDADAKGNVFLPNVNPVEEMVDLMSANRSFEANTQVITSARQMFNAAMRISTPG